WTCPVNSDPADYAKSMTDFASAQAEVAAENITAFAEIAKKSQIGSVEIMMAAGKSLSDEVTSEVIEPTNDAARTVKKSFG
ncbi:MAG: phasin, PhaP, partial [Paracoccaceae bacterium]|nr:phasin, PhaP [Paracoccaceae bacterium]